MVAVSNFRSCLYLKIWIRAKGTGALAEMTADRVAVAATDYLIDHPGIPFA
jgi:hypothetical protein